MFGVVVLLGGFSARQGQIAPRGFPWWPAHGGQLQGEGHRIGSRGGLPQAEFGLANPRVAFEQPLAAQERVGNAMSVLPPAVGGGSHASAFGGNVDDEAVLLILRKLRVHKEYLSTPKNQVPANVGRELNDVLPKQGLLPFLQRFPQYFEVALTGEMNSKKKPKYTFKLLPAINELAATAEPAVGGNGGGAGAAGSSGDGIGVVAPPATVSYYGPRPQTMPVPGNS